MKLNEQTTEEAVYYDDTGKDNHNWKELPKFPAVSLEEGNDGYSYVLKGRLYFMNGLHNDNPYRFSRYNPETNQWDQLARMLEPHASPCMVELDGYIYALSGYREKDEDAHVERYDIAANIWESVCPFSKDGCYLYSDTTAVTFMGKILISSMSFMGDNSELIMKSYNPVTNQWHIVCSEKCCSQCDIPILMVHGSTCYLALHLLDKTRKEETKVYELVCDLNSDQPTVQLGEEILQCSSITKYIGAFAIEDDIFVDIDGCPYKLKSEANREDDLNMLSGMTSSYFPVVYFTFNRQFYTSGVDKVVTRHL